MVGFQNVQTSEISPQGSYTTYSILNLTILRYSKFEFPLTFDNLRPLWIGRPQGVFFGFSYYKLIILFSNIVPLVVEFTFRPSDLKAELNDQLKVGDEIRAETILLININ